MAHKVHDAGLHSLIGESCVDGVRDALEAVYNGDQDIFYTSVAQVVHDRQPELGTPVSRDPQARNLAFALRSDPQGHVDGLVFNLAIFRVADFDPVSI